MVDSLSGKTAIVTGAGASGEGWGIGKAIAAVFTEAGARVFGVDRDAAAAGRTRDAIAARSGEEAAKLYRAYVADVTVPDQVEAMVRAATDSLGKVDILVNNVGVLSEGGCVEGDAKQWDRVHEINVKSIFHTVKFVLPVMRAQRAGVILNISSVAAHRWTGVSFAAYSSSKGAILSLTRAIALENAAAGVRAVSVSPGLMDTPMVRLGLMKARGDGADLDAFLADRAAQCPMGAMGDGFDVAHACAFLASDNAKYVTGVDLLVDGGLSASVA